MSTDEEMDILLTKITSVEQKVDSMDRRMDSMDKRMDSMDKRMDSIDKRMDSMETKLGEVSGDVKGIKLTIENELRVNIRRIAEGHLDLSRNLQEAMKPGNEVEMLAIRVGMLETDVREIKSKIS